MINDSYFFQVTFISHFRVVIFSNVNLNLSETETITYQSFWKIPSSILIFLVLLSTYFGLGSEVQFNFENFQLNFRFMFNYNLNNWSLNQCWLIFFTSDNKSFFKTYFIQVVFSANLLYFICRKKVRSWVLANLNGCVQTACLHCQGLPPKGRRPSQNFNHWI